MNNKIIIIFKLLILLEFIVYSSGVNYAQI